MKPTVGRICHYVSQGSPVLSDGTQKFKSLCRAAIISEVGGDGMIGLVALNPTGMFFHALADGGAPFDDGNGSGAHTRPYSPGSWHWPTECLNP